MTLYGGDRPSSERGRDISSIWMSGVSSRRRNVRISMIDQVECRLFPGTPGCALFGTERGNRFVWSYGGQLSARKTRRYMPETLESPHPTTRAGLHRSDDLSSMIDQRDHLARLAVAGELDMATVDLFTGMAIRALQLPVRVLVLDFGGVSFCGAAGVGALIKIHLVAAQAGIRLVLTSIQPHVRRVLDIAGTSAVIPVAHTRKTRRPNADSRAAAARRQSAPAEATEPDHSRQLQAV
jgi:anti-sigma B factor antagonist